MYTHTHVYAHAQSAAAMLFFKTARKHTGSEVHSIAINVSRPTAWDERYVCVFQTQTQMQTHTHTYTLTHTHTRNPTLSRSL